MSLKFEVSSWRFQASSLKAIFNPKGFRNFLLETMIGFLFFVPPVFGQIQEYNHPELKWRSVETEHFFVHFHQGEDRTASVVVKIAEEIYQPVISFYGYVPDGKIHFIIRDHEDDSNGAAYYYDNKIEIWASAMDFALRGTHHWLRNVVTHELVHIISLGAARKMPRQIPAVYLQWIGYEKEKRTDVIHGYPNTLVSFPLPGTVAPMWFAEGMTQTQIPGWNYDTWDSHRDMLLRTAATEGKLLSLNEMGIFGKNSIGNERVYNQGYGLVMFIVDRYGEKAIFDLVQAMKSPLRFDFNGAVKKALHKSLNDLCDEWSEWLVRGYQNGLETVQQNLAEGKIIEALGSGNFYPTRSPDGKQTAYISNRGKDYLSQTALWIRDAKPSGSPKLVADGVGASFSWSPDGGKIAYAKKVRNSKGSHFFDLFMYDIAKKKETRLSRSARLRDPDWLPDGNTLVCVSESDGTSNVMLFHVNGKSIKPVTSFQNGEQIFAPRWFGKTGKIIFSFSENGDGRDIAEVDSSGNGFRYLIKTQADARDPRPDAEGKTVYYASDKTGIFNVYRYDIEADSSEQLTNVIGGAFMPSVDKSGRLLFSSFRTDGYKIAGMDSVAPIEKERAIYRSPYDSIREKMNRLASERPTFKDQNTQPLSSKPYQPLFSKLSFYPRITMDFPQQLKVGTYFSGSDFLDRISIFGGLAANRQWDTDMFGIFQYRILYPTFFVEAYQIGRHTSDEEFDYTFNLIETDLGADWPLSDNLALRTVWQFSRYDAAQYFSAEGQRIKIPYTYHIGNVFRLHWMYRSIMPSVISAIAPKRGRSVNVQMDRASQRFMEGFAVHQNYGTLIELYRKYNYFQCSVDWKEYIPALIRDHSVAVRVQAGYVDRPVEDFYYFFAGGLDGLKGYPYYSIGGTRMAQIGFTYRFPIVQKMDIRFLWLNFDNLFLSLYGQVGNAWESKRIHFSDWKRDAGAQLRLGLFSFYGFPMALTLDASYGLDRFVKESRPYGHEWRYYFGLLFDFLD